MGNKVICNSTWISPTTFITLNLSDDIYNEIYKYITTNTKNALITYDHLTSWSEVQKCIITLDNGLFYLTNHRYDINKRYNIMVSPMWICARQNISKMKDVSLLQKAFSNNPTKVCAIIWAMNNLPLFDDIKCCIIKFLLTEGDTQTFYAYSNVNGWFPCATLFYGSNIIETITDYKPAIDIHNKVMSDIINTFKLKKNMPQFKNIYSNEIIISIFLTYITYRRGRIYLFGQINMSSGQIRILGYGDDHVYHSAECFGTNPLVDIKMKEVIAYLRACAYLGDYDTNRIIVEAIKNDTCEYFI